MVAYARRKATAEGPNVWTARPVLVLQTVVTATFGFVAVSRIVEKIIQKHSK